MFVVCTNPDVQERDQFEKPCGIDSISSENCKREKQNIQNFLGAGIRSLNKYKKYLSNMDLSFPDYNSDNIIYENVSIPLIKHFEKCYDRVNNIRSKFSNVLMDEPKIEILDKLVEFYMLIRENLTNALKYAYASSVRNIIQERMLTDRIMSEFEKNIKMVRMIESYTHAAICLIGKIKVAYKKELREIDFKNERFSNLFDKISEEKLLMRSYINPETEEFDAFLHDLCNTINQYIESLNILDYLSSKQENAM